MASAFAQAIDQRYRDQRSVPSTEPFSLAAARAGAEKMGEATGVPAGVTYEDVDAGGVPAQWAVPTAASGDRVVLYFHAGGYVFCSMRSHSRLAGHIARASGARVLNVDYRRAPEHPHPAPVEDALAAYRWVLAEGIEPAHIAVAGDSAGGGLALALLVKARDEGLPLPAAAALMSPFTDMALTGESITTRAHTDLISQPAGTRMCAQMFLAGQDPRDPYASPVYADLTGLPPLYIQVGDTETLYDDSARVAANAQSSGVWVRLDEFPDMQHDFQIYAGAMPEADDAVARIGAFVRRQLGLNPSTVA